MQSDCERVCAQRCVFSKLLVAAAQQWNNDQHMAKTQCCQINGNKFRCHVTLYFCGARSVWMSGDRGSTSPSRLVDTNNSTWRLVIKTLLKRHHQLKRSVHIHHNSTYLTRRSDNFMPLKFTNWRLVSIRFNSSSPIQTTPTRQLSRVILDKLGMIKYISLALGWLKATEGFRG